MISRLSVTLTSILWAATVSVEAQPAPFTVGPITAQAGETASGVIQIPEAADPGTELPVTVIHGAKPGPVLALVAGNHGYEYPPILALQKLRSELDPKELAGTVIMVHVANMPSFLGRTIYYSPIDRMNLNRAYPGRKDGTTSERITYVITTEVIEKCDYLLDLHCGDGNEDLRSYVYMPVTGNAKMDETIRDIALAFGIDHIVVDRSRPTDPLKSIYCSATGLTRGKPAITVESGYLGTTDNESIERIIRGVKSLMRHFQMLSGSPRRVENPVFLEPTEVLTSPATGILYPHVKRGRTVARGALLAPITDFFGGEIGQVRAPFACEVLYIVATPPVSEGEPVAMIGAMKH